MFGVAVAVLCVALIGLRRMDEDVVHYRTWIDGRVPAVVWEPGPPARGPGPQPVAQKWPVVIACHGFATNAGAMSSLSRALARAGYAVVAIDFSGHGRNPAPLRSGPGEVGLIDDIAAARVFAAGQRHFDGSRIALLGYGLGARAVISEAQRDPALSAVVAVSGARLPDGPYTVPNALLIWARWDPSHIRAAGRAVGAALAGSPRVIARRTYGDPRRGTALRVSEVDGVGHLTILYSRETARRIVAWLGESLGEGSPGGRGASADGRFAWSAIGFAALLIALWQLPALLAPRLPVVAAPAATGALARLAWMGVALLASLALVAGADPAGSSGALGLLLPLDGARELIALLLVSGTALLALAATRSEVASHGLGHPATWLCGALLLGVGVFATSALSSPFVDLAPSHHRTGATAAAALCALPYFAATEWWLRAPERGSGWLCAIGHVLTLIAIAVGALAGLLPSALLLGLIPIAFALALLEGIGWRLRRVALNPWLTALVQAGWTGWIAAALFPLAG